MMRAPAIPRALAGARKDARATEVRVPPRGPAHRGARASGARCARSSLRHARADRAGARRAHCRTSPGADAHSVSRAARQYLRVPAALQKPSVPPFTLTGAGDHVSPLTGEAGPADTAHIPRITPLSTSWRFPRHPLVQLAESPLPPLVHLCNLRHDPLVHVRYRRPAALAR